MFLLETRMSLQIPGGVITKWQGGPVVEHIYRGGGRSGAWVTKNQQQRAVGWYLDAASDCSWIRARRVWSDQPQIDTFKQPRRVGEPAASLRQPSSTQAGLDSGVTIWGGLRKTWREGLVSCSELHHSKNFNQRSCGCSLRRGLHCPLWKCGAATSILPLVLQP